MWGESSYGVNLVPVLQQVQDEANYMKKGDIMMSTLFINACVRENSRTLVLAGNILKDIPGEIIEVDLNQVTIAPLTRELLEKRDSLLRDGI